MIINYNCKTFIVQATDVALKGSDLAKKWYSSLLKLSNLMQMYNIIEWTIWFLTKIIQQSVTVIRLNPETI